MRNEGEERRKRGGRVGEGREEGGKERIRWEERGRRKRGGRKVGGNEEEGEGEEKRDGRGG